MTALKNIGRRSATAALLLAAGAFGGLASCALFDPEGRPALPGGMPEVYSLQAAGKSSTDSWWRGFGDSELDRLVEAALAGDFGILSAWTRLRQAQALAVQAGSGLLPEVDLEAGGSLIRQRQAENDGARTLEDYALGVSSRYEMDLWGRIRSEREAARLDSAATREDVDAAAVTVTAGVAERWAGIISSRMQKQLLESQMENSRIYLELVELRFRKGMVGALDVLQQQQVVQEIRSQIPLVEAEEQLLHHELAVLTGRFPTARMEITRTEIPIPETLPPTGVPADLLAARPDIRAAGLRLEAADWRVAAARANRLPAIRLTGAASYGAGDLELIFDNWFLQLAADLTAPIFDGDRRKAEVDFQRALADETLWAYRRTVVGAVKEVEDALVSEGKRREHIRILETRLGTANRALTQAVERYRRGLSDYLPVLTQILAAQGLERDVLLQRTRLLIDRIGLYRALGGGWTDSVAAEAPEMSGSGRRHGG
ncbi:efflux transporter outer membrane subunit [Desulfococcus sp.]|uniref:efflux transporter outer membrane subunit n=1 Tax=Desulfococcus sp. TaxID=2025834 RepID=UPI0035939E9D